MDNGNHITVWFPKKQPWTKWCVTFDTSFRAPTQFSLLIQMDPFFFLSMAALRATNTKLSDWLLESFQPTAERDYARAP